MVWQLTDSKGSQRGGLGKSYQLLMEDKFTALEVLGRKGGERLKW